MSLKENDTILGFITQILMDEEDDLENKPSMFDDSLALEATEKSLYEAININNNHHQDSTTSNYNTHFEQLYTSDHHQFHGLDTILGSITQILMAEEDDLDNMSTVAHDSSLALQATEKSFYEAININNNLHQDSTTSNYHSVQHHQRNEQLANAPDADKPEQLKIYDHEGVLLFTNKTKKKKSKGKKRDEVAKEFVDLKSLLMQCAEAISNFQIEEVKGLMLQIRRHSSPHGNAPERVAHYFANALEARLAGTGNALLSSISPKSISGDEILKGNKMFIKAVPLLTMTNLLLNETIMKKLEKKGATTLHIIDLGILLGFQWLSLILALSELNGGPSKLRITGIDFPQPGIRPDERVLETGARLAEYCERLRVPFAFNAIAQEWDTIGLEDLKIEKNEFVVVNSSHRLHYVMDQEDTVSLKVPRDELLKFIRKINPEMFLHGVTNRTYNLSSFESRFRDAFYTFSSLFEMLEATVPPEEEDEQSARVGFEENLFGRSVMSVVACEGAGRVDRPELYKQWQCRTLKAGFKQIPLDKEIVKRVKVMIREDYHKGFSMAKDRNWILLEWKGRVIYGISCWRPVDDELIS